MIVGGVGHVSSVEQRGSCRHKFVSLIFFFVSTQEDERRLVEFAEVLPQPNFYYLEVFLLLIGVLYNLELFNYYFSS